MPVSGGGTGPILGDGNACCLLLSLGLGDGTEISSLSLRSDGSPSLDRRMRRRSTSRSPMPAANAAPMKIGGLLRRERNTSRALLLVPRQRR